MIKHRISAVALIKKSELTQISTQYYIHHRSEWRINLIFTMKKLLLHFWRVKAWLYWYINAFIHLASTKVLSLDVCTLHSPLYSMHKDFQSRTNTEICRFVYFLGLPKQYYNSWSVFSLKMLRWKRIITSKLLYNVTKLLFLFSRFSGTFITRTLMQ